jgi:hypothetical protein
MTNGTAAAVIEKIDEALKDDKFETRQGLRFMATVMKEAMEVIGNVAETKGTTNTRIANMEKAINDFLIAQTSKEEKAEAERGKWRWAIISPGIGIILIELIRWLSGPASAAGR